MDKRVGSQFSSKRFGDDVSNPMNLDLNLGPEPDHAAGEVGSELGGVTMSLAEWVQGPGAHVEEPIYRVRSRGRTQWRWRHSGDPLEGDIFDHLIVSSEAERILYAGEASRPPVEPSNEAIKTCENNHVNLGDEGLGSDEEKMNGDAVSFFDCNICLELSKDPVVTCCGHLFCWSCLYRWLHVHSDAKECPVCKGHVKMKNVTPIYGRRNTTLEPETDPTVKIPPRPHAQRVESLRQSLHRNAFTIPIEEMIRRLGSRFDLSRDPANPQESDSGSARAERSSALLNRIMTSRGIRREQNAFVSSHDVVDLTQSTEPSPDPVPSRRLPSLLLRRSQRHRTAAASSIPPAVSSAEGLSETHFRRYPIRRHQDPTRSVEDRDSNSNIAAVINSESVTADNAVEVNSLVSATTSSSSRRNDNARVSDVDNGTLRPHRRRRLN